MKTVIALLILPLAAGLAAAADHGILLLAHGGNEQWNRTVASIAASLESEAPTETALGMADAQALQEAVDRLQKRGVKRIVALPLFVHSRSEVLEHTRYLLGLREQPSQVLRDAMAAMAHAHAAMGHDEMAHDAMSGGGHHMPFSLERVKASVPITMTGALDDSPFVGDIVWRRARALSRDPLHETVILVGHGPVDEEANSAWLATMRAQAQRVKRSGRFLDAIALTIRDDSPPAVKEPALARLREAVERASQGGGRAIVVPYLIARGGVEDHITAALEGLDYAWSGRTLCPDPAIERWARQTSAAAAR